MIVVIRRDIGNFPDVVGGVAHGHPDPPLRSSRGHCRSRPRPSSARGSGPGAPPAPADRCPSSPGALISMLRGRLDVNSTPGQAAYGTPGGVALGLRGRSCCTFRSRARGCAASRACRLPQCGSCGSSFQVFGHHVHVVLGVFAGRVALPPMKMLIMPPPCSRRS